MVRALRIASEAGVFIIGVSVSALWPGLPRAIGASLAIVGCVAMCMQIAFRVHDTNLSRNDVSLRD